MKLVSYVERPVDPQTAIIKLGALLNDHCVIDLHVAQTWAQGARGFRARDLPSTMHSLLRAWSDTYEHLRTLLDLLASEDCLQLRGAGRRPVARQRSEVFLLSPLREVRTLRNFCAFELHVRNTFRLQGKPIPQAWYEVPVFYYCNPLTISGPDEPLPMPRQGTALDYELGVACFIGKQGFDISPEEAADHIAGYTIMNNWSLRDVQQQEMSMGLGPTKSKDFATTLGPALVTPDELEDRQIGEGAELRYDLVMTGQVNGVEQSHGNLRDIHWTFAQMIAHASQDVTLFPGEVIGSGAVGTGSLSEAEAEGGNEWLKPGDIVTLEVEQLGRLETQIIVLE